ncbi:MAG: metallophosphoesterase [Comamonadaceae bacterium]|nr:MAG: metallophosphoesterase [Comamonadaceae bacterium]
MRLALLSDLHANLRALQACLADARRRGASDHAFLGDLVGYGAEPAQVVDTVRAMAGDGAIVLRGNHDDLAVAGATGASSGEAGARWTHSQLAPDQLDFLRNLPLDHRIGTALLVHASADAPASWPYVDSAPRARQCLDAADRPVVFCGHVHHQRLWYDGRRGDVMPFEPTTDAPVPLAPHRRWLATVGSVGQPRDGDTRAMYALWEPGPPARLAFCRVPYAHLDAAAAVRRAGLPPEYARRLEEGR